jgi:hypothetical protein
MAKKKYTPLRQFSSHQMKKESKENESNITLFEWAILINLAIYVLIK